MAVYFLTLNPTSGLIKFCVGTTRATGFSTRRNARAELPPFE